MTMERLSMVAPDVARRIWQKPSLAELFQVGSALGRLVERIGPS